MMSIMYLLVLTHSFGALVFQKVTRSGRSGFTRVTPLERLFFKQIIRACSTIGRPWQQSFYHAVELRGSWQTESPSFVVDTDDPCFFQPKRRLDNRDSLV
jgi:hypothetical protein